MSTIIELKRKYEIEWLIKVKQQVKKRASSIKNKLAKIGVRRKINKAKKSPSINTINIFRDGDGDDELLQELAELVEREQAKEHRPELNKDSETSSGGEKRGKRISWEAIKERGKSKIDKKGNRLRVKSEDIRLFTQRLSILLASGIPISKALLSLQESASKNLQKVIGGIYSRIQNGNSLSNALASFPRHFDSFYLAMVSVGEASGALPECLVDVTEFQARQQKISKKMKNASIYPLVIISVLLVLMILGSLFFIPKFKDMFADMDIELPLVTRLVFAFADNVLLIVVLPLLVLLLLRVVAFKITPLRVFFNRMRDRLMLRLPVVKKVTAASAMFSFANTVSLMTKNGIRIVDSMELAQDVVSNYVIEAEVKEALALIIEGSSLSEALAQQPHFDKVLCSIISTGEESGRINDLLDQASNFYSEQLNSRIDNAVELIQPLSIVFIAIMLLPVLLGLFLPLLQTTTAVS